MHKKYLKLPFAALLSIGLAGCGMNNESSERHNGNAQPMGYYSDENQNQGGNARVEDDNHGPIVNIFDGALGGDGQYNRRDTRRILQNRDHDGNPGNPSTPLANYDKNFFQKDNRYSRGDANYHGHLDDNTTTAKSSYYTAYEGDLAEKIGDVAGSVRNVEDVRSVVYGSDILIAVDLTDYSREEQTKRDIKAAVKPYLRGRSCTVVTDEGTFSRIRNLDNDLRDGGPQEQVNMDFKDMFRSLNINTKHDEVNIK